MKKIINLILIISLFLAGFSLAPNLFNSSGTATISYLEGHKILRR